MKPDCRKQALTFGEFIARVYDVCGQRKATGMVRLALQTHLVTFRRRRRRLII